MRSEYRYIGKDGMPILARDLEDQRDAALAKLAKAVEALRHEVKRSRRHLAASTLAVLAEIEGERE